MITSANLTVSAFDSNIEVGVEIDPDQLAELTAWFDKLWKLATPLTLDHLAILQRKTQSLRAAYTKLKAQAKTQLQVPVSQNKKLSDTLQESLEQAASYFVCNTNRRYDNRLPTGGYTLEQEMLNRGFAAAWEDFNYPAHMQQVAAGSVIFLFAKGVGIIGIGIAKGACETLQPKASGRIRGFTNKKNTVEWRVPVRWLKLTDEAGAYRWKDSPNFTFWDIKGSHYDDFRAKVQAHFLNET